MALAGTGLSPEGCLFIQGVRSVFYILYVAVVYVYYAVGCVNTTVLTP
jgi:hypothetical protein